MDPEIASQQLAISLGDIEIPIMLQDDPRAWLNASTEHLRSILQGVVPTFAEEDIVSLTDNDVVYPVSLSFRLMVPHH
jgi:hypothetical protein